MELAWELKERVVALTATKAAARDFKFCDEIRESARSAPDNIAEGSIDSIRRFCELRADRAWFLGEVRNQLRHAHSSKYLPTKSSGTYRLCRRAIGRARASACICSACQELRPSKSEAKRPDVSRKDSELEPTRNRNRNRNLEPEPRAKLSALYSFQEASNALQICPVVRRRLRNSGTRRRWRCRRRNRPVIRTT